MPLAERLSSKFQIYPQSLASWPKIHFLDNFSVVDIISRHTRHSRLPRQPSRVFPLIIRVSILSTSFFLTPKVVRQGTGECLETKVRKTIEVLEFIGHQHARVKLLDASAVSRGHINFDDLTGDISCGTDLWRTHYTYDVGYRGECGVPLPHHQDFLTTCLKAKFFQRQDRIWVLSLKKLKLIM